MGARFCWLTPRAKPANQLERKGDAPVCMIGTAGCWVHRVVPGSAAGAGEQHGSLGQADAGRVAAREMPDPGQWDRESLVGCARTRVSVRQN